MSFGDFLTNVIIVGAGVMIGGPAGGAIAGGLIGGARGGRKGALNGAALGALGTIIGAGFSEAGLFEGSASAADLGTEAATAETLTSGGATAAVGAPEAASTTQQLAQGTLAGGEAAAGDAATSGLSQFAGGAADIPGALAPATPGPGLLQQGLSFVKANPVASMLGLQAVSGTANTVLAKQAAEEKAEAERRAALAARTPTPSTGGVGVNLNIRPGDGILRRPDGTPVFPQQVGLLNSGLRR